MIQNIKLELLNIQQLLIIIILNIQIFKFFLLILQMS